MSDQPPKPPIALEQWLSFVISLPSHRSLNEGHRAFGSRVVKLVYDDIPAQYADDANAKTYLNHMLAEVSWAVRGFSAVRDNFQKTVQAQAVNSEHARDRAKGWFDLSPLKKESLSSKAVSIVAGAGGATALSHAFPAIPVGWNVASVIALAYTVHLFLDWLQASAVKRAIMDEPKESLRFWGEDSRPRYVAIARSFLEKAYSVEQTFYPQEGQSSDQKSRNELFDALIERTFAFEPPLNT